MRLTPTTILGQLIAGTVIVQVLVFVVFLSFSVRKQFNDTQGRDLDRLRKQTNIIAGLVAEPLTNDDSDLMDHVMHAVPIAASMKGARLTDPQGSVLRITSNDLPLVLTKQEREMLPDLATHPRYRAFKTPEGDWEGVQPVIADGLVRGIVWVTQDQVAAFTTPTRVLDSLLLYGPLALVGNLLLVWALSGSMARPLARLRRASQQVQADPNDLSAFPLPVAEHNEAGELTASVNAMVNEIALQRRGTQDTLNLLDSMLTGAPIGFGFYDAEYRYVRVNEQLAKMHGVLAADHLGRRLRDLLPSSALPAAEVSERLIQRVFDTQKPVPDNEIAAYLTGDGEQSTFLTSYFPVFAGGEVRWVGVIATDVTERMRVDDAVRRSEKQVAAGRLAASLANEIRNPLESITNLLYLLQRNGSLDQEAQTFVSMAQSETTRVGEITQQTLSFYRESKVAAEVEVDGLLQEVISVNQPRLRTQHIDTDLQVERGVVLFGYGSELRHLFGSLVAHAVESMPEGGTLYVRAQRTRRNGLQGLRITVAHNGEGVSEGVRRRMFEPDGATHKSEPNRLGPLVNEEILTKHRASFQVRSHQARHNGDASGTVFRIFFPMRGVARGPFIVHSSTPVLVGK